MKPFYLLLPLLVLFAVSCSDDDTVAPDPPAGPSVKLLSDSVIEFDHKGGTATVSLEVENLEKWSASCKESWVIIGEPDFENHTFTVSVPEIYSVSGRKGEISIQAPDWEETISLDIDQSGYEVKFHDRSTLELLGIKGNVKSMDLYSKITLVDFMTAMTELMMTDLVFNTDGMLTSFSVPDGVFDDETDIDIRYGSNRRIEKISAESWDADYEIILHYTDHGHYIATQDIFHEVLELGNTMGFGTYAIAWMPDFIQNLGRIEVYDYEQEIYYDFVPELNGNEYAYSAYAYFFDDDDVAADFERICVYTIENGYTVKGTCINMFGEQSHEYKIDFENGMITEDKCSYWQPMYSVGETWFIANYNIDRYNSLGNAKMMDGEDSELKDSFFTYNPHMDLESITPFNIVHGDMWVTYEYDDKGNWTSMKADLTGGDGGDRTYASRTRNIIYY